ncbi:MAG: hypothetical protein ACI9LM_001778 [Alteromonadaceae bacterium]|jgi:hypothetical protein
MSEQITQDQIDAGVNQAREEWEKMLSDSGEDQTMFIANNQEAIQFLGQYQSMKETLVKQGWSLPDLIDGVKVNLSDTCD